MGSFRKLTIKLSGCGIAKRAKSYALFLGIAAMLIAWRFPPMANGLFPEATIKLSACGIAKRARSYALFLGIATVLLAWPFPPMANGLFPEATIKLSACGIAKRARSYALFLGIATVNSVAFSPDGKWALSGSGDKTVRLWDCQTGKELQSFLGHSSMLIAWRFPPMANGLFPEATIKQ